MRSSRGWAAPMLLALCTVTLAGPLRALQERALTFEYIAHASFVIESPGGTRILLDPYADRVWLGYTFPRTVESDAILVTHPHYDHDGGELRGLDVPWPEDHPVYRDPGRYRIGDVRVHGVVGKHADPYGKEFGQKNTIWVVEVGAVRIAHLGDNGPLTDDVVRELGRIDVLMLPVDGEEHILSYHEIGRILAQLNPRVVIPMHYRIPELEPAEGPSDLGEIDPWIAGKERVRRLDGNLWRVSGEEPLQPGWVVVFKPSPDVPRR